MFLEKSQRNTGKYYPNPQEKATPVPPARTVPSERWHLAVGNHVHRKQGLVTIGSHGKTCGSPWKSWGSPWKMRVSHGLTILTEELWVFIVFIIKLCGFSHPSTIRWGWWYMVPLGWLDLTCTLPGKFCRHPRSHWEYAGHVSELKKMIKNNRTWYIHIYVYIQ